MDTQKIKKGSFKISPKFYKEDWEKLDLSKKNDEDWKKAIEIFKDRIEGRYFKQIEVLDKNKDKEIGLFSGFVIMSITCLLIETLEQFWTGSIRTNNTKPKTESSWLYKIIGLKKNRISGDALAFHSFFNRSEKFKSFFDTEEKTNVFYTKIRCGLLHQSQTKGKSLIHIRNSEPMLKWIDENEISEGISINRRLFLDEVKNVYQEYIKKLEQNDLNFNRQTLARKMKYIVEQK